MISFNYENDFGLEDEPLMRLWISQVIEQEGYTLNEINYVFCSDDYLHELNLKYLDHDTLTDIISFDYTVGKNIQGDIYISTDRVRENATVFEASFKDELCRVMVHGVLHYCGYKDKSAKESEVMRNKENLYLERLKEIQ